MLVLVVAEHLSELSDLTAALDAAGTSWEHLDAWSAASARLVRSPRPMLVLVSYSVVRGGGIELLQAADAQLRVLNVPWLMLFAAEERADVVSLGSLLRFTEALSTEREKRQDLFDAMNEVCPGVVRVSDSGSDGALAGQEEAAFPSGYLVGGRFRVEKLIASGGMGQIFVATQLPLGRKVALKALRSDLADEADAIARFEREAMAISRLNHPHTVVVYDYGVCHVEGKDALYLAMEWLEGESLAALITREGMLSPVRAAAIAQQTAESLSDAHAKGVIHRDLKPGNIVLLRGRGGEDYVKTVDFGIAKLSDRSSRASITQLGTVCGTPEFMSPEQGRGEDIDGRSDVYALGLCLFTMITGRIPFSHEWPHEVIRMQQTDPLPALPPHCPAALQQIILRCVEKRPDDRFSHAEALAAALRDFLQQEIAHESELMPDDLGAAAVSAGASASASGGSGFGADASDGACQKRVLPRWEAGQLSEVALARLLSYLWVEKKTGKLSLEQGRLSLQISVDRGQLLHPKASRRVLDGFLSAFAWNDEGRFSFAEGKVGEEGVRVDALKTIWDGLRRYVSTAQLTAQLGTEFNHYVLYTDRFLAFEREVTEHCGEGAAVFRMSDGSRTLAELFSGGLVFEDAARAVVFGLHTDTLVLSEVPVRAPVCVIYERGGQTLPSESARVSAAKGARAGVKSVDEVAQAQRQLRQQLAVLERGDDYGLFGLQRGCGMRTLEDAYFKRVAAFHPDRFATLADAEVMSLANEVFIQAQAAFDRLKRMEGRGTQVGIPSVGSEVSGGAGPMGGAVGGAREASQHFSRGAASTQPRLGLGDAAERRAPLHGASSAQGEAVVKPETAVPVVTAGTVPGLEPTGWRSEGEPSGRVAGSSPRIRRPPSRPVEERVVPYGSVDVETPVSLDDDRVKRPVSGMSGRQGRMGEREATRPRLMSEVLAAHAARQQPGVEDKASEVVAELVQRPPSRSLRLGGEEHFRRGLKALSSQNPAQALVEFRAATREDPEHCDYMAHLAWSEYLCDPSNVEACKRLLQKSIQGKEASVAGRYFLGKLALQAQDLEAAKEHFERVLAKRPKHVEAERELRLVNARLDEAKGLFGRLIKKVKSTLDTDKS